MTASVVGPFEAILDWISAPSIGENPGQYLDYLLKSNWNYYLYQHLNYKLDEHGGQNLN